MSFLVITNSYNRKKDLVEKSLRTSLQQLGSDDHLLYIDQNPSPLDISSDISANSKMTTIHHQVKGVSEARNIILKQEWIKKYVWLVFCDDDGYFSEKYLETLNSIIENHPDLEIVAGSILNSDGTGFYSPRHQIGGSLKNFAYHKLLMGSNFAVKLNCFIRLNGFDSNFGTGSKWGSGEESDFCINAYFHKIPMEYFKQLSIYHLPPRAGDLKLEIKKAWKYAVGKGALIYKWLIKKKKPIVILELVEMLIIPWVQFAIHILKLNKNFIIFPAVFFGRLYGFMKAALQ